MSSKVTEKMSFTAAQCRAARGLLGWSQAELAASSTVATKTLADFERGARVPYERTLADIRRTLESAGIEFLNHGQPGVRMRPLDRLADVTWAFVNEGGIPTQQKQPFPTLEAAVRFVVEKLTETDAHGVSIFADGWPGIINFLGAKSIYNRIPKASE
jgi:transcriptional regulator with XRE-family HTH domain